VKTAGGHHRIPETEIHRFLPAHTRRAPFIEGERASDRSADAISLIGRVVYLKVEGLMAQVTVSIAGQHLTSHITPTPCGKCVLGKARLRGFDQATEVMLWRPK